VSISGSALPQIIPSEARF